MWLEILRESGGSVRTDDGPVLSRLPTAAELDAVERKLKVRLPASYRSFCQELGPGELGVDDHTVQITAPCRGNKVADLMRTVKDGRKYLRFAIEQSRGTARGEGVPEILADVQPDRTVSFARDHSGASFFWRTDEPTTNGEYAIYALADEVPPRILRVADSFEAFFRTAARGPQGLVDIGLYGSTSTAGPQVRGFWPVPGSG
ncbi:MAG: SMI1/KNR4 family protein [Micromonosporaceae bacterium]|nr:SMI1/KNR4 family protein [Micromonosporaceae bacterium]